VPGESKSSKRRIEAKEKQKQALQLRLAGVTFDEIAERLGYAQKSGAWHAVAKALNDIPKREAMDYKLLNLERLNRAILALWSKVLSADLQAILALVRIVAEINKLTGAYEPLKLDITEHIREMAKQEGWDPDEAVREAQRIMEGMA